jgi:tetratricopeptide (TPR) repeat protein
MRRVFLALLLVACGAAFALGQSSPEKLEADAKKAFDAGRFREAADKYSQAAKTAGLPPERRADLHVQAAWSHYIAGSARGARDELAQAFAVRPDLEVVADFYSPEFASLSRAVRAEVAPGTADPGTVIAGARAKLENGKAEEALADLKRLENSSDPRVPALMADAYERLGRSAEADAARRRASELERNAVSSSSLPPGSTAPATGAIDPSLVPATAPLSAAPMMEAASAALRDGNWREAEVRAKQALEIEPRSSEAHRIAADAALAQGRDADAEREYTASRARPGAARRQTEEVEHRREPLPPNPRARPEERSRRDRRRPLDGSPGGPRRRAHRLRPRDRDRPRRRRGA